MSPAPEAARLDWRQVRVLLGNALRVDVRSATLGPRARRTRARWPLLLVLFVYLTLGMQVAFALEGRGLQPNLFAAILYALTGSFVLLAIVLEFGDMLWAPADTDIILWRPIAPPTLFAYRALHVLSYVGLLTVPLLLPATLIAAWEAGRFSPTIALAFLAGGYLAHVFGALILLGLYSLVLRRLPPTRFHSAMFGLQVVFMVVLLLSQYVIGPLVENLDFTTRDAFRPACASHRCPGSRVCRNWPPPDPAGSRWDRCCSQAVPWHSRGGFRSGCWRRDSNRWSSKFGTRQADPSRPDRHSWIDLPPA